MCKSNTDASHGLLSICRNKEIKLRRSFNIMYHTTPTVVMFHRGHTYKYTGNLMDQEALVDFAVETFHESEHKVAVPKIPTFFEELRDLFSYSTQHKGGLLSAMLMRSDDGSVSYLAVFGVYILPFLIVFGFYKLMQIPFNSDPDTVEKTRVLMEKNRLEKEKIERWIQKHPTLRRKYRKWE